MQTSGKASSFFYTKLSYTNLKNNIKLYGPYGLMNIFMISLFYMIASMSKDPGMGQMQGGESLKVLLTFGLIVIGIFAGVMSFYTNSFLMKRRKKEIGVYNVLGMGKRHIARMMAIETAIVAVLCIVIGLATGALFSKLLYMFYLKILGYSMALSLPLSIDAMIETLGLFIILFVVSTVYNVMHVIVSKPIELVRGSQVGEKEPKTKWVMTLIGLVTLASGYGIALTVKAPLQAITWFFLAVVLVMVGTYALFTTGSIVLLKGLRHNKAFYYKTKNFTVVSGMLYRMKQNAAGLASICILATMVIISLSTTVSMYVGLEDLLDQRYPTEGKVTMNNATVEDSNRIEDGLKRVQKEAGLVKLDLSKSLYTFVFTQFEDGQYKLSQDFMQGNTHYFVLTTYETYLKNLPQGVEQLQVPAKGQVLAIMNASTPLDKELTIGKAQIEIQQKGDIATYQKTLGNGMDHMMSETLIIFNDYNDLESYYEKIAGEDFPGYLASVTYDFEGDAKEYEAFAKRVKAMVSEDLDGAYMESRTLSKEEFINMYGGMLFLGIFLGTLFIVSTVLIMYYKQISEGYDDKTRFETMQKVGMSHQEIRSAIKSQTVIVFFLPLIVAVVHIAFAFNFVSKLLALFGFLNTGLYVLCMAGTIAVFALFYYAVYRWTARAYFKIVSA